MAKTWPAVKDPNEVKDYEVRFGVLLDGDTISSILACSVVSGSVVIDSSAVVSSTDYGAASSVRIWFSAGTHGETCEVLTRVDTAGGRTFDQTAKLKIKAK